MKKILTYITAISVAAVAATGCTQNDDIVPTNATKTLTVVVDNNILGADTKATFTDGDGFAWEATDNANFYCLPYNAEGSTTSSAVAIDSTTGKATFTFTEQAAASKIWFLYGPSVSGLGGTKKEYNQFTTQTQTAAGVLDKSRIALISDPITLDAAATELAPQMRLAVAMQRILVYSSEGTYATEEVQSVSMTANEDIGGVIGFSIDGKYCDMDGGNANEGTTNPSHDEPVIFWAAAKTISVTVSNPALLTATNRDETQGTGVYMATFPTTLTAGYSYKIITDKAIYSLPAATVGKTFENGKLYNIFVNLDGAGITRVEAGLPQVRYEGSIAGPYTRGGEAQTGWEDIGWWFANVSTDGGSTWTKHEGDALCNELGLQSNDNITFTFADTEGTPVTWLRCRYKEGTSHWEINYDANETDAARTCVVTATFNIPGYEVVNSPKTIRITQNSLDAIKVVTYKGEIAASYTKSYTAITAESTDKGLSWWYAEVDGMTVNQGVTGYLTYYNNCTFTITDTPNKAGNTVDWCTCAYRVNDTWWDITLTENPSTEPRTCYIVADFADIVGHTITNPQKSTIIIQEGRPEE